MFQHESLLATPRSGAPAPRCPRVALGLAVLAAATLVAPGTASAQSSQASSDRVSLSQGSVIPVILNTELSSNGSTQGDTFTASVDSGNSAYDNILRGATVTGEVHAVTAQRGSQPGTLDLDFTRLRLADGRSYAISGSPTSMDASKLSTGADGILRAKNTSQNNRLTYAGIGAGAGALVGILNGGKLKIEDLLLGGLAGYGVGSILKSTDQVHDVVLKQGTPMGVLLDSRVDFARQSDQSNSTTRHYHQYTTQGNTKYYQYNGQSWAMNRATGERYMVSDYSPSPGAQSGKNYTYQGHRYHMDSNTGERTQLD